MFLVSSPTQDQVGLETNAIEAAEAAGVELTKQLNRRTLNELVLRELLRVHAADLSSRSGSVT